LGKIERKDNGPQGGLGPKQRIKKMGCINGFRIYFKDLSSKKIKDLNTCKPNFELGPN
jgi:hypothetical protein